MTDMQTPSVNPGTQPLITPAFHEAVAGRLKESMQALEPAASSGDPALRARLAEIGARAQKLQVTAGAAWQATEALSNMEQALSFALDTAREARDARSLPEAALAQMQKHVDLAINTVDGLAAEAAFGGRKLFDGGMTLDAGGKTLGLPKISSSSIGSSRARLSDAETLDVEAASIDYSKSVASAGAGGPNSLSFWADGAVTVLEDGIKQIERLRGGIEEYRGGAINPAVNDIDVMMSNALATEPHGADLEQIVALLADVKKDLGAEATSLAAPNGEGVIKLLD